MGKTGRLCVYDSEDENSRDIANGRDADLYLGADSVGALQSGLDRALAAGHTFRRVVFDTHGSEGSIYFGKGKLNTGTMRKFLSARGYERLFPNYSRMYFSGCNISDDETGWRFLEEANEIFFSSGGGVSLAYTSVGIAVRWTSVTPKHLWGDLRLVIRETGKPARRYDTSNLLLDIMSQRIDEATLRAVRNK